MKTIGTDMTYRKERKSSEEFTKIRVQGIPEQIKLLKQILEINPFIEMINFSDIYSNKGTEKYKRAYADIMINEKLILDKGIEKEKINRSQVI